MCDTCGCNSKGNEVTITRPGHAREPKGHSTEPEHSHVHDHHHSHPHHHPHDHAHTDGEDHVHTDGEDHAHRILVQEDILAENNLIASRNRGYFEAKGIVTLNLMSSPGSGKTTLLEQTIRKLENKKAVTVIEGDQQTLTDAERIEQTGVPVIQVNTGNGCHLDASMVRRAVRELAPPEQSILFIENVGNLVCPSLFELGEIGRVVIMSTTEGEDKPLKYPTMFRNSDVCIINKTDLLPHLNFNIEKAKSDALNVNPGLTIFEMSAITGEGVDSWVEWILSLKPEYPDQ